jgi:hypothetical protein
MTRAALRALAFLLCLAAFTPARAAAQTIEVRGRGDATNDAFLRRLIQGGDYRLIAYDTLLGRNDTIRSTALVVDATLRLEGTIEGDLIIVDANVFIRPTARVLGSIRNISGGLYYSELAAVGGAIESDPNAPYRADRPAPDHIVIRGMTRESPLLLYGIRGLQLPTYDRVDGLTVSVAAGLLLPRIGDSEPVVRGRADYRSARGDFTGGVELGLMRRRTELVIGAERTTLTNERWIRSDLSNTISSLVSGRDRRDYYEADRAYVELRRLLERGPRVTNAFLRLQAEDAEPLAARNPWSLFGDFRPDNIPVVASRITSASAGMHTVWRMPMHVVELTGLLEGAADLLDGDHEFGRFEVDLDWAMAALSNHTLSIDAHAQGPLPGSDSLPLQRWSFVGGAGTLPTFSDAAFRGDRVIFVETAYSIPLPARLRVRVLGRPDFELLHMAGMAWTADETRAFEQNVGVRLRFNILYLRLVTDPDRFQDAARFSVGVQFPRRPWPWQETR